MSGQASGVEDYVEFLQTLLERTPEYFLFGGQAVNFWADYFDRRSDIEPLHALRPFTSKDCDIWVSSQAWREVQKMERRHLVKGSSPTDGQLGILTLQHEPLRVVDLLSGVFGIRHDELARLCQRAPIFNGIKVIDPLSLFRSKCHCFLGLPQGDRQDERHVRMLALILPEYLSLLIDEGDVGNIPERELLKEVKLLIKIAASGVCRRCLESLSIESNTLIPWRRLGRSRSELLANFARAHAPRKSDE
ncbi:MAG: hypothetical protein RLZZ224_1623 [Verrucomicrobiota bacterium]|jgi:hypothetical protein